MNVLFAPGSGADFKDASHVIAEVGQGGMGLPERDFYFRKDDKSEEVRKQTESAERQRKKKEQEDVGTEKHGDGEDGCGVRLRTVFGAA